MDYQRYGRNDRPQGGYGRDARSDYDYGRSSAREYMAADETGGRGGRHGYGRDAGFEGYGQRDRMGGGWGDQQRGWTSQEREGFSGGRDYYRGDDRGSYGERDYSRGAYGQGRGGYDRQYQGGGDNDRGFFQRAGDEVRSWFGDEDAERRRERDARMDEPTGTRSYAADPHYQEWRNRQIDSFDRDYHEYRQENQDRFHNEFSSWRTDRQGQRDLLNQVEEHADVVGSDGEHVGTVDKVRGDRIILTKNDADAGGRHHSIPSRWLQSADAGTVTLRKTAAEAKQHWRDEERSGAMSGDRDEGRSRGGAQTDLNRSFSGTY